MQLNNSAHFTVQLWMVDKLKLRTTERDVFAIIYGFSQDGQSDYHGSLSYMATLTGYSRNSICTALKNLTEKNLIIKDEKTENNIKYCSYRANIKSVQATCMGVQATCMGVQTALTNNNINNKDNKVISKDINNIKNPEKDNFLGSAKAEKKPNLYSNCISLIDDFINEHNCSSHIRKLLITHLDIAMENRSIRGQRQYKGILNKLYDLHEQGGDYKSMIQYSIEKGYPTFYSRNSSNSNYKPSSNNNALTHESGAKHVPKFTEEDEIKQERFYEKLKKQGKQIVF